ncbi:MAG: hypothetical protein JWN87_1335 [Frankiales bacterium]|nr:hypothetical protein [Frankiales bacterium]
MTVTEQRDETALTAHERLVIEAELTRLSQHFVYFMDCGDFESMIGLFTPDAVFDRAGIVHHGHEELREGMRDRPKATTRHLLANFYFRNVQQDSAEGVVCGNVYHGPPSENGEQVNYATEQGRVVEFTDTYVRTSDGWRYSSRLARPILAPKVWP